MTAKNETNSLTISLEKEIHTEHYPIVVAEGLDVVLKTDGYKRLAKAQTGKDEFDWENEKAEKLILKYYTQVNSIAISNIFNIDLSQEQSDSTKKHVTDLYKKLNDVIGLISQYLDSPYVSTTREVKIEISGEGASQATKLLLPVFSQVYTEIENIGFPSVDMLEHTDSLTQVLFSFSE